MRHTLCRFRHFWRLFLRDFWRTAASSQFDTPDKARYFEGVASEYHKAELAQAIAAPDNGWNRPILTGDEEAILDIGCGPGTTFIAWFPWLTGFNDYSAVSTVSRYGRNGVPIYDDPPPRHEPRLTGIDPDENAIAEGKRQIIDGKVRLLCYAAEEYLPLVADATFDLVMSRVSLVYGNIPKILEGAHRTLKRGGKVWFTLHTRRHSEQCMERSNYSRGRRWAVHVNSWLLRTFEFTIPIRGRHESYQHPEAFVAMLDRFGFDARYDLRKSASGDDELRVMGTKR